MRVITVLSFLKLLALISIIFVSVTSAIAKQNHNNQVDNFFTVDSYDPKRDPYKDLEETIHRAETENKRIILQVGGEWCSWCHLLSNYIQKNKSISSVLEDGFLVMKVNISKENDNHKFLARYPSIEGYPHIYILGSDGSLLHSQDTDVLEDVKDYNQDAMLILLNKWALSPKF